MASKARPRVLEHNTEQEYESGKGLMFIRKGNLSESVTSIRSTWTAKSGGSSNSLKVESITYTS